MKILEIIEMFQNAKEIYATRNEIEEKYFKGIVLSEKELQRYKTKMLKCKDNIYKVLKEHTELKVEEIEKIVNAI